MSYNKKIWANGDLITKERMNNIEDGIYNAHEEINTLKNNTSTGGSNNASDISITDTGNYFTNSDVEGALQEVGSQIKDIKNENSNNGMYINAKFPPSPLVGITEDDEDITSKLQAMVDSLPLVKENPLTRNGTIYIPTGKYSMGSAGTPLTVPLGVSIEGDGDANMYAVAGDRKCGTKIFVNLAIEGQSAIIFQGAVLNGFGGHLKGVNFSGGNGVNKTSCVELNNTFAFSIRECSFEHLQVYKAIACKGTQNNLLSVSNCRFSIIGDGGDNSSAAYTYGVAIDLSNAADCDIMNNFIECCGNIGILLGSADCKIMGNFIDLNKFGIYIMGHRTFISNNTIKINRMSGIAMAGNKEGITITNNILYHNAHQGPTSIVASGSSRYAIDLNDASNSIIMHNIIDCYGTCGGINISNGSANNIIKDNIIKNMKTDLLDINDLSDSSIIQRYLFENSCNVWYGTKDEYDALTTKYEDVLYVQRQNNNNLLTSSGFNLGNYSIKYNETNDTLDFIYTGTITPTIYTVTNNLTNSTTTNTSASIEEGSAYSATITANSGYTLNTVSITMGGADITSSSYSNGVINISNVTGNIVITATTTKNSGSDSPTTYVSDGLTVYIDSDDVTTSGSIRNIVDGGVAITPKNLTTTLSNGCINFVKSDSTNIFLNFVPNLTQWTAEIYFKATGISTERHYLIGWGIDTATRTYIGFKSSNLQCTTGNSSASTFASFADFSSSLTHLVVTHSDGVTTMYKNGVQIGQESTGTMTTTNYKAYLGCSYDQGYSADMEMKLFRFYDGKVLTASEIEQNYNASIGS